MEKDLSRIVREEEVEAGIFQGNYKGTLLNISKMKYLLTMGPKSEIWSEG